MLRVLDLELTRSVLAVAASAGEQPLLACSASMVATGNQPFSDPTPLQLRRLPWYRELA
jgi:hypothetical protein